MQPSRSSSRGVELRDAWDRRIVSVLFQLTKLANTGTPLPDVLTSMARAAVDLSGADTCSIMLLDGSGKYLLTKASHGLSKREEEISFRLGEGIAGWVAEHGEPVTVTDAAKDARFRRVAGNTHEITSMLSVPLVSPEGVLGALSVGSSRTAAFNREHQELLVYLASSMVKDIENARLYRLSITDSLTGAYNRQYLFQRLPHEMERCSRYGDPLAIVLLDVDHFKRLNDRFGHPAGDCVLQEMVRLVHSTIRGVDGLVRYGGEEFLLMLPKTSLQGARDAAERLRAAVERTVFRHGENEIRITISLGVTCMEAGSTEDVVLQRADELLYRAKDGGRNRVEAA